MIAASLWVLLAAIIAVYVISQRISEPIKSIGKAAKSFALGDFSVRVDVTSRDEVGQLAVAFNNMAASLAKTDELRSAFVANVSHDLRTPMTVISGYVDGILDGHDPRGKARLLSRHHLGRGPAAVAAGQLAAGNLAHAERRPQAER